MSSGAATRPSEVRIQRVAATSPTPWRNGGGLTRRLLTGRPVGGTMVPSPSWTLSLADLNGAVSFSRFGGMDRTLLFLCESPLQLHVDGDIRTVAPFELLRFPGEAAVELSSGHGHALNLMTQRGKVRGSLSVLSDVPSDAALDQAIPPPAALVVLRAGGGFTVGDTVVLPNSPLRFTEDSLEQTSLDLADLPTPLASVQVHARR